MVYNIVAAALILANYNPRVSLVTNTECALTSTEVSLSVAVIVYNALENIFHKKTTAMQFLVYPYQIFSIWYSSLVINYYLEHRVIDESIYNMSVAIVVMELLAFYVVCKSMIR